VQQARDLCLDLGQPVRVREIALGQRDGAAAEAEQVDDLEVLARLRHGAVVGRDHQ
jgi:hypothetical protein